MMTHFSPVFGMFNKALKNCVFIHCHISWKWVAHRYMCEAHSAAQSETQKVGSMEVGSVIALFFLSPKCGPSLGLEDGWAPNHETKIFASHGEPPAPGGHT